jgi:hypothetical protein
MKLNNFIQFQPNQHFNTNVKIFNFDAICLDPSEWYCQVLDVILSNGATFHLVDCNDTVLQSVLTFRSGLFLEFTIQNTYYYPVRLRATDGGNVYFSTPFVVYENQESLRIDYKLNDFYQSIRVHGYFTTFENISAVDTYTQERGLVLSGYSTITTKNNYTFEKLDNYTFLAINEALSYPEAYINGARITDKPLLKAGAVDGQSNIYQSELQGSVDLFDIYTPELQIAPRLVLTSSSPAHNTNYTTSSVPTLYQLTFNQNIELLSSANIIMKQNGVNFVNLEVSSIVANVATLDFVGAEPTISNASYQLIIPANKFKSIYRNNLEIIINFVVSNVDFNGSDFNNLDFFTA